MQQYEKQDIEKEHGLLGPKAERRAFELSKPATQRLEAWMMEITDLLCYQPDVPLSHKTELVNALKLFQKEINNPVDNS